MVAGTGMWDFGHGSQIFRACQIAAPVFCSDVANLQQVGGVDMSIETLLLILIMTLGVAAFLNRLDAGRHL
jgi:hypothetical protein